MVHLLSGRHRSEFLAVPELTRITIALGKDGPETTLLLKASTLSLKYVLQVRELKLTIARLDNDTIGYSIEIPDDPSAPGSLYSVAESTDELDALKSLRADPNVVVFLFNELAVSVGWADARIDLSDDAHDYIAKTSPASAAEIADDPMQSALERGNSTQDFRIGLTSEWHPIKSTYVTNQATASLVSLFDLDEGGQQEEMAIWLVDNLKPTGATKSPQVHEETKVRELTDLALSHAYGSVLLESKALSVLSRDKIPTRDKLTRDLLKHLKKATDQLVGGIKNVRRGLRVTDLAGKEVSLNRTHKPHVIILVPDLSLLANAVDFGSAYFEEAGRRAEAHFHILDPSELLRMVQVAEMLSENNDRITKMIAFDWYLLERSKVSLERSNPYFGMLFSMPGALTVVSHD